MKNIGLKQVHTRLMRAAECVGSTAEEMTVFRKVRDGKETFWITNPLGGHRQVQVRAGGGYYFDRPAPRPQPTQQEVRPPTAGEMAAIMMAAQYLAGTLRR